MSKKKSRFYLLTLGCPKNVVDSEGMSALLAGDGYRVTDDPARADVLIVNTCGFLRAASDESVGALRELAAAKRSDQMLVAAGCMAQRLGADLARQVPGLDGLIGTRSWADIVPFLQRLRAAHRREPIFHLPETGDVPIETATLVAPGRRASASAYLKIGDGCSAPCAFCTIPSFKGLVAQGTQEIILIAQDTTAYGRDRGEQHGLATLVEDLLAAVPDLRWLRLMYAYPGHVDQRLIEVMAAHPQVCHYLDLPLQHGHPDTLRRMRRPHNVDGVLRWIEAFRAAMPDAALRTTFIVGYPGENEAEFQGLLDFMQAVQFDRVGVFPFSREPGTPAYDLPDQVPDEVKQARYERAMEFQQAISLAKNQAQVGRRLDVLVDGAAEGVSIARSYRDAPEIDGFVIIEQERPAARMLPVLVTGATVYDLLAVPADQPIMVLE
jgi:ribosomal protein S12 methylthiotransferase